MKSRDVCEVLACYSYYPYHVAVNIFALYSEGSFLIEKLLST